jgi:hypothetical protein
MRRGVLLALLLVSASAWAGDEKVTVVLRSGERVEGTLVGLAERRWRVQVGSKVVEVPESEVKRIDFADDGAEATAAKKPSAAGEPASASEEEPVDPRAFEPAASDLPRGLSAERPLILMSRASLDAVVEGSTDVDAVSLGNLKAVFSHAQEVRVHTYSERGALIVLAVFRAATRAEAAAGFDLVRGDGVRGLGRAISLHGAVPMKAVLAGNVFAFVADGGVTRVTSRAFRELIEKRLASLPGKPTIDDYSSERAFSPALLVVPTEQLPSGLTSCKDTSRFVVQPKGMPDANPEMFSNLRASGVSLEGEKGTIEVLCREGLERGKPEPTPDELASFRKVWVGDTRAVSIGVTGELPAETVAWVEKFVADELARCSDMKAARVLGGAAPKESPAKDKPFPILDLVPVIEELPKGLSIKPGSLQSGHTPAGPDTDWASFVLVERDEALLISIARTRDMAADIESYFNGNSPGMVLATHNVFVALREMGETSAAAWEDLLKLFTAKLARLEDGDVTRKRVPFERPSFTHWQLQVPPARLPDGVRFRDERGTSYASGWVSTYDAGPGEVQLGLIDAANLGELKNYRAVWVAFEHAVTVQTKGDVPGATLDWFIRWVETELAIRTETRTAKRVEIPKPKLVEDAASLAPLRTEFPGCLDVVTEGTTSRVWIELETEKLTGSSPTMGPLLAAVNAGATSRLTITFRESRDCVLVVQSYATIESAALGFDALKHALSVKGLFKNVREVFLAGNVVARFEDAGISPPAYAALRKALLLHIEPLGLDKAEAFPVGMSFARDGDLLYVAPELAPGVTGSTLDSKASNPLSVCGFFEECKRYSARRVYTTKEGGQLALVVYWAPDDAPFAKPRMDQVAPFRSIWLIGRETAISLRVEGTVPEATVNWFRDFVEKDIAGSADGNTGQRYDAPAEAPAETPKAAEPPKAEAPRPKGLGIDGLELKRNEGAAGLTFAARVVFVVPGSKAEKLGFEKGDRIMGYVDEIGMFLQPSLSKIETRIEQARQNGEACKIHIQRDSKFIDIPMDD